MRLFTTLICILSSLHLLAQNSTNRNWIHTEVEFVDSVGNKLIVTNSLPKGGGNYRDPTGNMYSYLIFWYRVTNNSEVPLELTLEFPAKPFEIFPSSDSHIRIFLPPENMSFEKIERHDYGVENLKGFLDAEFNKSSGLQRIIDPGEESLFYISILVHEAEGTARSSLVMKGEDLFYQISIDPDSDVIPCGQISFKD